MPSRTSRTLNRFVVVMTAALVIASVLVTAVPPAPVVAQSADDPPLDRAEWMRWARWATANQRNDLAIDEPINWVTRLQAHNAMASIAYERDIDPNQYHTITRMLDDGVRIVSLDIHVLGGDIYFCHSDFCEFPFFERDPYENIIAEMGDWLENNPNEFIWLRFEFNPDSNQEAGMSDEVFASEYLPAFELTLQEHFGRDAIYGLQDPGLPWSGSDRWPSLRQLRSEGKQVLMSSTHISKSSLIWYDGRSGGVLTGPPDAQGAGQGTALEVNLDDCIGIEVFEGGDDEEIEVERAFWTADPDAWSEVTEARTLIQTKFEKAGVLTHAAVEQAAKCNVAIIGLDFVSAMEHTGSLVCEAWDDEFPNPCAEQDLRLARTVWSWAPGYYPDQDFAFLDPQTGWVSAANNAGNRFHFACAVPRDGAPATWADKLGERWEVTRATGTWSSGDQLCAEEFDGVEFAVPVNGWQNERLKAALADAMTDPAFDDSTDNVWLKYHRSQGGDRWVQTSLPTLASMSTEEVGDVVEITTTVDNPAEHDLSLNWEFSDGRSIVSSNVDADPLGGFSGVSHHRESGVDVFTFSISFGAGPHSVDATLWHNDGTSCGTCFSPIDTIGASFQYENLNNLPVLDPIGTVPRSDLQVVDDIDGPARRLQLRGTFTDSDDDNWQVTVDYGDGSGEQSAFVQSLPRGGQFFLLHDYANLGEFLVTVTVTEIRDGQPQGSSTGAFLVINHSPGVEPEFDDSSGCGGTKFLQGEPFGCRISFFDPNVDTDSFEATVDFGDGTAVVPFTDDDILDELDGDRELHFVDFQHGYKDPGTYELLIRVTDDGGRPPADKRYIEMTIPIQVFPTNTPPTVDAGPDVTILPGETFTRTFTIDDPDIGDTFSGQVWYEPSLPPVDIEINPDRTFTLSHTYTTEGVYPLVIDVNGHFEGPDGPTSNGGPLLTIVVRVATPNTAPVLDAGGDVSVAAGETFTRTVTFTDPDADTWLTNVTYGDGPVGQSPTVDPTSRSFELAHTWASEGTYEVGVVINDGRESAIATFTVTVTPAVPTTPAASVDPAEPDGEDGWYVSPATVTVEAVDPAHDVEVDLGDGWVDYTGPITLDTDGIHTVAYRASNPAGTSEVGEVTVPVDVTAPTVAVTGVTDGDEVGASTSVDVAATVADTTSGPAGVRLLVDGQEVASGVTEATTTLDGTEWTLGDHTVTVEGTDVAGNATTTELVVTIVTSPEDVAAIVDGLAAEGLLDRRESRHLTIHLDVGTRLLDRGLEGPAIEAFERALRRAWQVHDQQARDLLVTHLETIIAELGA